MRQHACVVQEGDPQKVTHASWQAHCLMTRNLLFDLELLAHADYFVGTTKSGLSPIVEVRLAFLVSSCRIWAPVLWSSSRQSFLQQLWLHRAGTGVAKAQLAWTTHLLRRACGIRSMGRVAARSCCMEETGMKAYESISGSIMFCRTRMYTSSFFPFGRSVC